MIQDSLRKAWSIWLAPFLVYGLACVIWVWVLDWLMPGPHTERGPRELYDALFIYPNMAGLLTASWISVWRYRKVEGKPLPKRTRLMLVILTCLCIFPTLLYGAMLLIRALLIGVS